MKIIRDFKTVLLVNLKCFFSNRLAVGTMLAISAAFLIISTGLVKEYEKKASLPIGVIDLDESQFSKELLDGLENTNGFTIYKWTEEELEEALKEEKVYAYFVINKGYEEKIKSNNTKHIIQMYYLKDYNFISIISDIFAKSTMEKVLLYRGEALYEDQLKKNDIEEKQEYLEFVSSNRVTNPNGFFDYQYLKVENGEATNAIETKNSILTTEIYLGVVTLFISFLGMFFVLCQRRGKELKRRLRICLISNGVIAAGNVATVLLGQGVACLFLAGYVSSLLHLDLLRHGGRLLWALLWFSALVTAFFFIISKWLKSETIYQLFGVLFIFLVGGLSIMASIGQITVPFLDQFAKNIPNYWFITDIIDIILAG